jgi:hypothetical protein
MGKEEGQKLGRGRKSWEMKSCPETGETGCRAGESRSAITGSANQVPVIKGSNAFLKEG